MRMDAFKRLGGKTVECVACEREVPECGAVRLRRLWLGGGRFRDVEERSGRILFYACSATCSATVIEEDRREALDEGRNYTLWADVPTDGDESQRRPT